MNIKSYLETKKPYLNPLFGVDQLAQDLNITTNELRSLSIEQFKKSPRMVIEAYRMRAITTALRSGYVGLISDLAVACGYRYDTFQRSFKRYTGITPSQYRASIKKFRPQKYLKHEGMNKFPATK